MALLTPLISGFHSSFHRDYSTRINQHDSNQEINLKGKRDALWFAVGAVIVIFTSFFSGFICAGNWQPTRCCNSIALKLDLRYFRSWPSLFFVLLPGARLNQKNAKEQQKKSRSFRACTFWLNFPDSVLCCCKCYSGYLSPFAFQNNIIFYF